MHAGHASGASRRREPGQTKFDASSLPRSLAVEPWQYDTAEDLDRSLLERLRHFPRRPDMLVYGARIAAATLLRAWLRVYHRLSIHGREHLPKSGSFVLVANHASHLDALAMLSCLPLTAVHRAFPAAAKDFFFESIPRLTAATILVNALPFDREVNIRQSLTVCRTLLESPGNVLLLFPEGTRSQTGQLGPFKPGVGLLLVETRCPVIPCYLDGPFLAMRKGARFPRPRKIRVFLGAPRDYSHLKRGKASAVFIANDLREAILSLAPADANRRTPPTESASLPGVDGEPTAP
jgi:1-acyl-sn-glycerol-3-phosphate acyltransferase